MSRPSYSGTGALSMNRRGGSGPTFGAVLSRSFLKLAIDPIQNVTTSLDFFPKRNACTTPLSRFLVNAQVCCDLLWGSSCIDPFLNSEFRGRCGGCRLLLPLCDIRPRPIHDGSCIRSPLRRNDDRLRLLHFPSSRPTAAGTNPTLDTSVPVVLP